MSEAVGVLGEGLGELLARTAGECVPCDGSTVAGMFAGFCEAVPIGAESAL